MHPPLCAKNDTDDDLETNTLIREVQKIDHRNLTSKHAKVLTKSFILNNLSACTLARLWDYLPEAYKVDEEIRSRLPCADHYNRPEDHVHVDGPPQPKYRCRGCIRERMLREEIGKERRFTIIKDTNRGVT